MSMKCLLNDEWKFARLPLEADYEQAMRLPEEAWEAVDLPHDWLIYRASHLYDDNSGWYRKTILCDGCRTGVRTALRFEGVYMDSVVYVNGAVAGEWKYGYSTFEFDITELLRDGENEIVVGVHFQSPNSRWYSGAGIYRNVWLKTMPETHIASDGVYVSIHENGGVWFADVTTEVVGIPEDSAQAISVRHTLLDCADGSEVLRTESISNEQTLPVEHVKRWDIDSPNLYVLRTELLLDGAVIDCEEERIGFRTVSYDCEKGFFLNGRHIRLNGACQHHDLGCLGAAVNRAALERQFALLREMGVNAVRTSHNMPSVELMDIADETGMLIVSEAFDMWENPKTPYDYARFFKEWMPKDVASWIRRDRNRPSVIMWSIGNEIYDTHASAHGQDITRALCEQVRLHDSRGNAPITIGSNFMYWEGAQKCADIVKFAGYNYSEKLYEEQHAAHPDWLIYGSETASTVQSRGIYHFPLSQSILADEDEQCSSLGNSTTSWGAKSPEACIIADRDTPFSAGQFIWTGFDYIGEPTPYHTKNSYFGQIDTAGFPKDSFYLYQSEWTDYKKAPMVHIFPYWDFNEGQLVDVRVCSNAPRIELFFNGESVGAYDIDHVNGKELTGNFVLPYTAGELKAVAYDETGAVIATDTRHSFGDAAAIVLKPDKTVLRADGSDLAFIEISMQDENGYPVENANNRVAVSVEGAGRLVGLDNGDSTDYDQYKGTSRRLFSGKLLAVVAADSRPGEIRIRVTSLSLPDAVLTLEAEAAASESGRARVLTGSDACRQTPAYEEIPVRKIEIRELLSAAPEKRFDAAYLEKTLEAVIYPANATYRELEWRITTDAGVTSNLASFETLDETGTRIRVTAQGDGAFRVRCSTRNGKEKINLFSQTEFFADGLGEASINPYEFVAGALFNEQGGEIGNGNEQGIATSRDGDSWVGFRGVDFGSVGSDVITVPVFELESGPVDIEFWDGLPNAEGSECVGIGHYHKPSIWNTYQEETFTLNRRLKGMVTLCMLVHSHKIHVKGFVFKKYEKAYEQLRALDNTNVYGDTFTICRETIEGIGNNVSLTFEDMDFGTEGFRRLTICGRSPIEKNTIHVRFASADGEVKQIAEFLYSDSYVERTFDLESVCGKQTVTFVFMPGCNFDFKWFRFEK